jgi:hypothetical protein
MESKMAMGQLDSNSDISLCSKFHEMEDSLRESNNLIDSINRLLERKITLLLGDILEFERERGQKEALAKSSVEPAWIDKVYKTQLDNVMKLIKIKETIEKI